MDIESESYSNWDKAKINRRSWFRSGRNANPVPKFEGDDHLHAAVITGNRDLSMNLTNFVDNLNRLPVHTTFTSIIGGNHQQFGSYDPSGRSRLRDRPLIDGNATISRDAQLNATADALVRTLLRATKNNDISPRSLVDC